MINAWDMCDIMSKVYNIPQLYLQYTWDKFKIQTEIFQRYALVSLKFALDMPELLLSFAGDLPEMCKFLCNKNSSIFEI